MTVEHGIQTSSDLDFQSASAEQLPVAIAGEPAPISNLAALLDRFTQSVTKPESHTVGNFAEAVQALHGELAMLARHFGAEAYAPAEQIDFDDIFAEVSASSADEIPLEPGIAQSEELEHLCRDLSR